MKMPGPKPIFGIAATFMLWPLAAVIMLVLFSYRQLRLVSSFGFKEIDSPNLFHRPLLLTAGCLVGILSKAIYDQLIKPKRSGGFLATLKEGLAPEKVTIAILLSPIVILSGYSKIDQVNDPALVALLAYQTGFFFQTVLNGRRAGR
jgi:hypothetical protein